MWFLSQAMGENSLRGTVLARRSRVTLFSFSSDSRWKLRHAVLAGQSLVLHSCRESAMSGGKAKLLVSLSPFLDVGRISTAPEVVVVEGVAEIYREAAAAATATVAATAAATAAAAAAAAAATDVFWLEIRCNTEDAVKTIVKRSRSSSNNSSSNNNSNNNNNTNNSGSNSRGVCFDPSLPSRVICHLGSGSRLDLFALSDALQRVVGEMRTAAAAE